MRLIAMFLSGRDQTKVAQDFNPGERALKGDMPVGGNRPARWSPNRVLAR